MCLPWPQPDPHPELPTCWVSKKLIHSPLPSKWLDYAVSSIEVWLSECIFSWWWCTFDTLTSDYCYRGDWERVLFGKICKIHPEIPMVIVNNIPELTESIGRYLYMKYCPGYSLINWQNMGFPINFLSARLSTRACSTRGKYYNLSVWKIWKHVTWSTAAAPSTW